jgi:hypothetical protein
VDHRLGVEGDVAVVDHAQKLVLVDVVLVPPVDEVLPLVRCPQVVDDENVVDTLRVELPDQGAADEASAAGDDDHDETLLLCCRPWIRERPLPPPGSLR